MPARRPRTPRTRDQLVPFQARTPEGKERLLGELSRRAVDTERRQGSVDARVSAVETGLEELEEEVSGIVTSGPVPSSRTIATSGGLTGGGDLTADRTLSIADGGVTLAKIADVATQTILGRATAGTGDPEALTAAQATTLLDVFTTSTKGLVPAPVSASGKFLSDAGTWSAPAVSFYFGDGSDGDCVFDGSSVVADITPSSNVYKMTRDMFFDDLEVQAGVTLDPGGFRIWIKGTWSGAGKIAQNGGDGPSNKFGDGGNATTGGVFAAGAAGAQAGSGVGSAGGAASNLPRGFATGASTAGAAGTTGNNGGDGGTSGGGGGGGGGGGSTIGNGLAGGAGGDGTAVAATAPDVGDMAFALLPWVAGSSSTKFGHGTGGGAGGRGGHEGTNFAGAGGAGGGWVTVVARICTFTGSVEAKGGNGGDGGPGTGGGDGGSGGGGGGQGGFAFVLIGSGTLPTVDVSGGTGGQGGVSVSGGNGGDGGDGQPGRKVVVNLSA